MWPPRLYYPAMLDKLTAAQREAVTHFEGPLLILAGPGSGKTRVITHRVAWLLAQGVAARNILALTFTNKAAEEMSRRIAQLAGERVVWVGTFHRFCARMLRKYAGCVGLRANYAIYDSEDSVRAVRRTLELLKMQSSRFRPEAIAKGISWAKNNLVAPDRYRPGVNRELDDVVQTVYPVHQRYLISSNAADFDDLLFHMATILRDNPEIRAGLDEQYRFVLVDEYQDTNLAQYAIVRALSIDYPNLAVTGDPDQSIYGWRGANLNNILEFEKDYPQGHVVRLEQNYRSTSQILRVAAELIAHNVRRKEKRLFTENAPGEPVRLTTYATNKDEARGVASRIFNEIRAGRRRARDFAVFYRINALSRSFEFALRELGVPYQLVNGMEFFQRKEIKDILAYLRLLHNPRDDVALLRIINSPPRGIGKTTIGRLSDYAAARGLTLLDAAREITRKSSEKSGPAVKIGSRPLALLARFVELFDRLSAAVGGDMEELVGLVLSETGYQQRLQQSETEEDEQRLANIEELLTVARDFDERGANGGRLEDFLEETSLVSDTDAWTNDADRVTLMTLHASKGLEFPGRFSRGGRGGAAAARAEPRLGGAVGRGASADVRRHYPRRAGVAHQHGPLPRFSRPAQTHRAEFISYGTAAGRNGAGTGSNGRRRRGTVARHRPAPGRPGRCEFLRRSAGNIGWHSCRSAAAMRRRFYTFDHRRGPRRRRRPIERLAGPRRIPAGHVGAASGAWTGANSCN